jgi:hypothetical protein
VASAIPLIRVKMILVIVKKSSLIVNQMVGCLLMLPRMKIILTRITVKVVPFPIEVKVKLLQLQRQQNLTLDVAIGIMEDVAK